MCDLYLHRLYQPGTACGGIPTCDGRPSRRTSGGRAGTDRVDPETSRPNEFAVIVPADEWITVPVTAKLLGLTLHTVRALIDELTADFVLPSPPGRRAGGGQSGSVAETSTTTSTGSGSSRASCGTSMSLSSGGGQGERPAPAPRQRRRANRPRCPSDGPARGAVPVGLPPGEVSGPPTPRCGQLVCASAAARRRLSSATSTARRRSEA
jgi:hypothetical protein